MGTRPLHVLLTDPHERGGGQVRYVVTLATALARRGNTVSIGCRPNSLLAQRAEEAGLEAFAEFNFRGGGRLGAWRADVRAARRLIREFRPDIVHPSGSQDHWTFALANRLDGRPACLVRTRHNTYPVHNGLSNRLLNLRWTDYQIVVCEEVRAKLARQTAFDASRMCTSHNGVDPNEYHRDEEARASARAEFGYAADHVVLGIAARLNVAKGHVYLFRAAAQLRTEFPQMRLLILGQGPLKEDYKKQVAELGLSDNVTFAGFREDIGRCVQAFDVGVQPSIDCEASSFSLMEQMATEIPIVTSDHGGSKEIVRDGVDGRVVPAGTVEPLAGAIRPLVSDPALRRRMGESARQRILDDFSVDALADRTLAAYDAALKYAAARGGAGLPGGSDT